MFIMDKNSPHLNLLEHFDIRRGLRKGENVNNDQIIFNSFLLITQLSILICLLNQSCIINLS